MSSHGPSRVGGEEVEVQGRESGILPGPERQKPRFPLPTPLRQRPLPDVVAHRWVPGGYAFPRTPLGLILVGFLPEAFIALLHSWLITAWWWEES